MKLAFDVFPFWLKPLGQQVFVENFLKSMMQVVPRDWQISICTSGLRERKNHYQRLRLVDPDKRARWIYSPIPQTIQQWLFERTGSFPYTPALNSSAVIHSLRGLPIPGELNGPVATIQDVIPIRLNEGSPEYIQAVRRDLARLSAQAVKIITISEFSKAEITTTLNVDPDKIQVIPNGVDHSRYKQLSPDAIASAERMLESHGVKRPYILHMGGGVLRKNAARAVAAFSMLKETDKIQHMLVLAGASRLPQEVEDEIASSRHKDEIKPLGYLPAEVSLIVLQLADMLVFPSTYEGFGLPPLEAMACGVPVVLSDAASLPEVGGDAVIYVDPLNVESMVASMSKLISDQALRKDLIEKGLARSNGFSWIRNAEATLAVYRSILN